MTHRFIQELNERNLCTWYVLPWLGLNPDTFGKANMVNSYLVKGVMAIAVEVADSALCPAALRHSTYLYSRWRGPFELLVYDIPREWSRDYELFLNGKYSKMSEYAKQAIRERCGLRYMVPNDSGVPFTDAILLALERHPMLKKKWLEVLGDGTELPEELLSSPNSDSFIDLQSETTERNEEAVADQ